MAVNLAEAANAWAARHPMVVKATTGLEQSGITSALTASSLHEIAAIALDVPLVRAPDDVDLLIPPEHFDLAARALGGRVTKELVRFPTGDGGRAEVRVRECLARVGGDKVQFMDPKGPLRVTDANRRTHEYTTAYTQAAAGKRTVVETDYGLVPLAHTADAVAIYAMGQRRAPKNDLYNTGVLLGVRPLTDLYSIQRAGEMGWDRRVWRFVWAAGSAATHRATQPLVQPALRLAA